jgi:hypothetical protein
MIYVASALVSFVSCFLKGFQHKNVIGGHLKAVYFTSWFMALFDVVAVLLIVEGGWPIAISTGFGASLGMIVAVTSHDKIFGAKK